MKIISSEICCEPDRISMASNQDILHEDLSNEQAEEVLNIKHSSSNMTKLPFKQPASKYDFVKVERCRKLDARCHNQSSDFYAHE